MEVILIILFIYILILSNRKDLYEMFRPNETQFTVCPSKTQNGKGETLISIKENSLPTVQKGFYTSVIESTGEKKYTPYFQTPTCSLIQQQSIRDFYGNNIIDYDKDKKILINPMDDPYSQPEDNYSILYPNIFNDKFVEQHKESIQNDERF